MPGMKKINNIKKKFKIITRGKSHSLKDSWLYNICSKRRLCEKLEISIDELNRLIDDDKNYQVFIIDKNGRKKRKIQAPKFDLDKVHSRIASLLARIEVPRYLHSGIKGKSNITNAKMHLGEVPLLKLDIRDFYLSTSQKSIFHFFSSKLNCAQDVAGLLSSLCSYKGHVPTGSRISMVLAFLANQSMFDRLYCLCEKNGINMTVFVDDLTFSGEGVNQVFKKNVIDIIKNSGMHVHQQKTKLYSRNEPKVITGVVITGHNVSIRNKHHKTIYELFNSINNAKDEENLCKLRNELIGRLSAAGQVDNKFKQRSHNFQRKLRDFRK